MSAKSVIELWLWGGPSSLETFDPKPGAPADYANGLKAIPTNVPGMSIHEWWPELARCADLYSLVRTMTHPHFGHETATYLMQTGRSPGGGEVYPAIGAVIAMIKARKYRGDLPPFVILTTAKGRFSEIGFLGERNAPLVTGGNPNGRRFVVDGIVPPGGLDHEAVRRRFDLLADVDTLDAGPGSFAGFDDAGRDARRIIEGDAAKTFDLSVESPETRDRYGRTWIGQSLLAARRLVEYGVPYITVNMSGWDSHKRHFETMRSRSAETDRALAALLRDLADRKLLDTTIVWVSGEFGRTPRIDRNPPWNGGRNHYPTCFSALVAGGGFAGGRVVGESDETASHVVKRPVTPVDFLGSIYELCGINPDGPMPNHVGKRVPILPPPSPLGRLKELYRHALLPLACAGLLAPSLRAAPYVGYVYPAGAQTGTTNRVIVGGQFWGVRDAVVSGEGVRVLSIEHVPNFPPPSGTQRKYLVSWLKGIAEGERAAPPVPENARTEEWRSNSWWTVLGSLDTFKLSIVERDLYSKRNALQMSPSLRGRLIVTLAVDARAKPGVREFRVMGANGISPPRPFLVSSAPHQAEPLFAAPFHKPRKPDPVTDFPAVLDGTILPGESDFRELRLKKGRAVTFRVVARELQPYIGDAVPGFFNVALRLTNAKGGEVGFADDRFQHPDPVLRVVPPADGLYTLEVRDVLFRGRDDFVYSILVEPDAAGTEVAFRDLVWPEPSTEIPEEAVVATFRGTLGSPRTTATHSFRVDEAGDYVLDLLARRAGSPLDGRLSVLDASGRVLAEFSDITNTVHRGAVIQAELDPIGRVRLPTAGEYRVRVRDEEGKGGDAWRYVLRVHRPAPRLEVWLAPSSFGLLPGARTQARAFAFRHDGFSGDVHLQENEFVRFVPDVIPAASNEVVLAVVSKAGKAVPVRTMKVTAIATTNGAPSRTVQVVPADAYNQAFAWDHLLPSRDFVFRGLSGSGGKTKRAGKRRTGGKGKPAAKGKWMSKGKKSGNANRGTQANSQATAP